MKYKQLTLRTDPMTKLLLALVAAGLWWHAFAPWVSTSAHADGRNKSGCGFVGWGKDSNDQSGGSELFRAKLRQKERAARL